MIRRLVWLPLFVAVLAGPLQAEPRGEAAAGLTEDNLKLEEFRKLLDSLYRSDLMTRSLAIQVLKRGTGKTMGYNPRAFEEHRERLR